MEGNKLVVAVNGLAESSENRLAEVLAVDKARASVTMGSVITPPRPHASSTWSISAIHTTDKYN